MISNSISEDEVQVKAPIKLIGLVRHQVDVQSPVEENNRRAVFGRSSFLKIMKLTPNFDIGQEMYKKTDNTLDDKTKTITSDESVEHEIKIVKQAITESSNI